jgi:hypothetical protein
MINNIVDGNQTYSLDYIPLDGNMLQLDINIELKDSMSSYFLVPEYKKNLHIEIPIVWKGFASFSAGSFLNVDNRLKNIGYVWQQVANRCLRNAP